MPVLSRGNTRSIYIFNKKRDEEKDRDTEDVYKKGEDTKERKKAMTPHPLEKRREEKLSFLTLQTFFLSILPSSPFLPPSPFLIFQCISLRLEQKVWHLFNKIIISGVDKGYIRIPNHDLFCF